eukprot:gnl/MRDRNA2_/MRDRNA2_77484_c0_seq1.p1 gnl/MRDRNA2_/MRDRNA2_77484_c0~~gnl/MRDRNA2_/MRDRNA2_77484_c0_seq1.p1  ORF type:complete len:306 (-),score=70.91 gnl/MRDRNA2_/MRDRNA2_77484_c0_seq1:34-951(-)
MRSLAELEKDLAKRRGESFVSEPQPEIASTHVKGPEKQRVKESHPDNAGSKLLQMIKGNGNVPLFSSANSNGNPKPGVAPSGVQILELAPALLQEPPFHKPQCFTPDLSQCFLTPHDRPQIDFVAPQEPYCASFTWSRDKMLRWRPLNVSVNDRSLLPQTMMMPRDAQQQDDSASATNIDEEPAGKESEARHHTKRESFNPYVSAEVLEEAFEEAFRFSSDEEDTPEHSLGFRKWFNRDSSADTTTTTTEAGVSTDAGSGEETTDEDEAGSQKCVPLDSPESCSKSGARSIENLHAMHSDAAQQS